jgi:hypothetical protein
MNRFVSVSLVVLLVVTTYGAVFAGETGTLICKGGIVSIGDTVGDLLSKCGQPVYKTQREQKRVEEGARGARERFITTTVIDDWLFNFGPNEFQYQVLLANGRVARMESLGYGY